MNSWFGFAVNFKWPHDGFVLGISWDFFDYNDECPWTSCIVYCAKTATQRYENQGQLSYSPQGMKTDVTTREHISGTLFELVFVPCFAKTNRL